MNVVDEPVNDDNFSLVRDPTKARQQEIGTGLGSPTVSGIVGNGDEQNKYQRHCREREWRLQTPSWVGLISTSHRPYKADENENYGTTFYVQLSHQAEDATYADDTDMEENAIASSYHVASTKFELFLFDQNAVEREGRMSSFGSQTKIWMNMDGLRLVLKKHLDWV